MYIRKITPNPQGQPVEESKDADAKGATEGPMKSVRSHIIDELHFIVTRVEKRIQMWEEKSDLDPLHTERSYFPKGFGFFLVDDRHHQLFQEEESKLIRLMELIVSVSEESIQDRLLSFYDDYRAQMRIIQTMKHQRRDLLMDVSDWMDKDNVDLRRIDSAHLGFALKTESGLRDTYINSADYMEKLNILMKRLQFQRKKGDESSSESVESPETSGYSEHSSSSISESISGLFSLEGGNEILRNLQRFKNESNKNEVSEVESRLEDIFQKINLQRDESTRARNALQKKNDEMDQAHSQNVELKITLNKFQIQIRQLEKDLRQLKAAALLRERAIIPMSIKRKIVDVEHRGTQADLPPPVKSSQPVVKKASSVDEEKAEKAKKITPKPSILTAEEEADLVSWPGIEAWLASEGQSSPEARSESEHSQEAITLPGESNKSSGLLEFVDTTPSVELETTSTTRLTSKKSVKSSKSLQKLSSDNVTPETSKSAIGTESSSLQTQKDEEADEINLDEDTHQVSSSVSSVTAKDQVVDGEKTESLTDKAMDETRQVASSTSKGQDGGDIETSPDKESSFISKDQVVEGGETEVSPGKTMDEPRQVSSLTSKSQVTVADGEQVETDKAIGDPHQVSSLTFEDQVADGEAVETSSDKAMEEPHPVSSLTSKDQVADGEVTETSLISSSTSEYKDTAIKTLSSKSVELAHRRSSASKVKIAKHFKADRHHVSSGTSKGHLVDGKPARVSTAKSSKNATLSLEQSRQVLLNFIFDTAHHTEQLFANLMEMRLIARQEIINIKEKEEKLTAVEKTIERFLRELQLQHADLPIIHNDLQKMIISNRVPANHQCRFCACYETITPTTTIAFQPTGTMLKQTVEQCKRFMMLLNVLRGTYVDINTQLTDVHQVIRQFLTELVWGEMGTPGFNSMDPRKDAELNERLHSVLNIPENTEDLLQHAQLLTEMVTSLSGELTVVLGDAKVRLVDIRTKNMQLNQLLHSMNRIKVLMDTTAIELAKLRASDSFILSSRILQVCVCPYCHCYNSPFEDGTRFSKEDTAEGKRQLLTRHVAYIQQLTGLVFTSITTKTPLLISAVDPKLLALASEVQDKFSEAAALSEAKEEKSSNALKEGPQSATSFTAS